MIHVQLFKKDLDSLLMLHRGVCPNKQPINANVFSRSNQEPNSDNRAVTNLPAASFNIQDTDGLLPMATPMPSVSANQR